MKYTGDVFKKFNNDKYSRVDALHKLDFFYGKDEKGNASLLLQTSCKVEVLPSTNCIVVEAGWRKKRQDMDYILQLETGGPYEYFCLFLRRHSRKLKRYR